MAQEAQEGPNTPVGRADQADRVGRATTAVQEARATAAQVDPATADPEVQVGRATADPADLADPDGRETTADLMIAVATGARHPPICPGAGWTRAGSTTSRSTTTAGG